MTKCEEWFVNNVVDDVKEIEDIGSEAIDQIKRSLRLGINNPKVVMAIYGTIFDAITDVVSEREDKWDSYELNIANRLIIGYNTTDSEDDEKVGNFMVYMKHCKSTQSDSSIDDDDSDQSTINLATQWNSKNITESHEVIKEISGKAKAKLGELINIKLESHEFIIPLFCIVHNAILEHIRLKRRDGNSSDYSLNVAGLYTVGVELTEDGDEEIYYLPSISLKLKFKNDKLATGSNEG